MIAVDDVTELLRQAQNGHKEAESRLFTALYSQLRAIAAVQLRSERRDHTLQPTALVHEVYLRLRRQRDQEWENRAHYLATAAKIMRRTLVDYARRKSAGKRGGSAVRLSLDDVDVMFRENPDSLLIINEALERLAQFSALDCQIVEMRFIGGLSNAEIADVLRLSVRTVNRSWRRAKAWLAAELKDGR